MHWKLKFNKINSDMFNVKNGVAIKGQMDIYVAHWPAFFQNRSENFEKNC
jgi:hypothetical protein